MAQVHWLRSNGFLLALVGAVLVAFLLPEPGARGGVLHADLVNNFGIALILFLQGLSLAFEKIKSGAGNWRLHAVIQGFTFLVFPVVGILFHFGVPLLWPGEPAAIRDGFLYLCVLPSTVSTSVVLTAVAHGNTPGALFNAALSNILGVFLTPVLVQASEVEMLRDDARRYVNKARAAGSPVRLQTWNHMVHVWQIFNPELTEACDALAEVGRFLAEVAPPPAGALPRSPTTALL